MQSTSTGKRKRISNRELQFYEDTVARLLRIIRAGQAVMLTVDDPDVLEDISGHIAIIIKSAGQIRRAVIEEREFRKQETCDVDAE